MEEAICHARYVRIAPRKVRLVAGLIRGLTVEAARRQLQVCAKSAAKPMLKALDSAVANAVHNLHLAPEGLAITRILVNEGPKIKRVTPRAQGRATPIRLRMSHVTIAVAPSTPAPVAPVKKRAPRGRSLKKTTT